jgi:hypothetical protein
MKRAIYGTIALFVGVLIVVYIISRHYPIRQVEYKDGKVVEMGK